MSLKSRARQRAPASAPSPNPRTVFPSSAAARSHLPSKALPPFGSREIGVCVCVCASAAPLPARALFARTLAPALEGADGSAFEALPKAPTLGAVRMADVGHRPSAAPLPTLALVSHSPRTGFFCTSNIVHYVLNKEHSKVRTLTVAGIYSGRVSADAARLRLAKARASARHPVLCHEMPYAGPRPRAVSRPTQVTAC